MDILIAGFLCIVLGFFCLQFLAYGSLRSDNGSAFLVFILLGGVLIWAGFHLLNQGNKILRNNNVIVDKLLEDNHANRN